MLTYIILPFALLQSNLYPNKLYTTILINWLLQIITQRDQSLTIDLHTEDSLRSTLPKNCGKLLVHAEECVSSKTAIEMVFRCSDLECKDLFSRNVWTCVLFLFHIMKSARFATIHVFVYLAGPLFIDIKSCRRWCPNSNLQNRSYKEWSQPNMEICVCEYSTSRKQGIELKYRYVIWCGHLSNNVSVELGHHTFILPFLVFIAC